MEEQHCHWSSSPRDCRMLYVVTIRSERGGDGRHHCTPFGKMTHWSAGHALARPAAQACLLKMMEWLEWLMSMMDIVECVLVHFERGGLRSNSPFTVFTCAVSGLHMIRTWRDLKWGTMEPLHSLPLVLPQLGLESPSCWAKSSWTDWDHKNDSGTKQLDLASTQILMAWSQPSQWLHSILEELSLSCSSVLRP